MQTLPNGVVVPNADGKEQISTVGVTELRTTGASADTALGTKASTTYVDAQDDALRFDRGNPGTFDFNTFKKPGTYSLGSPFPAGWTNVPAGIDSACTFKVDGGRTATWCSQELDQFGTNPKRIWRISRTTQTWNPWQEIRPGVPGAMSSNAAWLTNFVNKMGGPVNTNGKAAFALRLDHGWAKIKADLRAALLARGIVAGVATNSRKWGIDDNVGVTASEVNGWVAAGEFEILNHSATHNGGLDEAGLMDEIVNGRLELESQLPAAAPIWGFAPPGVTAGWDGFDGGALAGWGSVAAQIILSSHAYSLGYVGGVQRVLDGTVRQGLTHITLDSYDLTAARAAVDTAIASKTGIQFMLHPRELDQPGKITTSAFLSFLDYVVGKRTAGDLVTLTPNKLVLADASRRTPAAHTHPVADVTGLSSRLAALEYDSGWRDITSMIPETVTGSLLMRREGRRVWLDFRDLTGPLQPTANYYLWPGVIPAGFRVPRSWQYLAIDNATASASPGPIRLSATGEIVVYGAKYTDTQDGNTVKPTRIQGLVSWITDQTPPATPPGSTA